MLYTLRFTPLLLAVAMLLGPLTAAPVQAGDEDLPVKHITMQADNWSWSPREIRVTQGTKLILKIKSYDATHRFDLKQYGLKVVLPQDKTTTVEFVADKAGTFKWRCGRPCGDGCPRMTGKLIVEPAAAAEG